MAQTERHRRRYQRVPFDAKAHVACRAGMLTCQVLDISLKGVLLAVDDEQACQQDEPVSLAIDLGQADEGIEMQAVIRHVHDGLRGCQWKAIELDSLMRLRRLLELNKVDPGEMEREFIRLADPLNES